jgi:FSR family fosmidomycin resistance protein-like MFS transporter
MSSSPATTAGPAPLTTRQAVFPILLSLGFCHLLNDLMQSLLPALYPMLKAQLHLDFGQIGMLTLAFMLTASLLQPSIGMYTDKKPLPYSLAVGMGGTLTGLVLLSMAESYMAVLLAACFIGTGSAVFHPEASRVARAASGGRYGIAQSIFQVGGNLGGAIGPLLAAFIILPRGQASIAWFSLTALLAMLVLARVGMWYAGRLAAANAAVRAATPAGTDAKRAPPPAPAAGVVFFVVLLMVLVFSKNAYNSSITTFFTFYLMEHFRLPVQAAQVQLFVYMAAVAVGTLVGGHLSDKIGRRPMIWVSILGALPFTLMLPYANLFWTGVLTIVIALVMASAFPAILVYAHELLPGRVGMVSGMFFGFSFGLGGLAAAGLGQIADAYGIVFVYHLTAWLPAIGLLVWFLPDLEKGRFRKA